MAQLQKQRELKAAGIDVYKPTKVRGVDYNVEIPFEIKVPEGRHVPTSEETPQIDLLKSNTALKQLEQKTRDEEENKRRVMDLKRLNKLK